MFYITDGDLFIGIVIHSEPFVLLSVKVLQIAQVVMSISTV